MLQLAFWKENSSHFFMDVSEEKALLWNPFCFFCLTAGHQSLWSVPLCLGNVQFFCPFLLIQENCTVNLGAVKATEYLGFKNCNMCENQIYHLLWNFSVFRLHRRQQYNWTLFEHPVQLALLLGSDRHTEIKGTLYLKLPKE